MRYHLTDKAAYVVTRCTDQYSESIEAVFLDLSQAKEYVARCDGEYDGDEDERPIYNIEEVDFHGTRPN